MISSLRQQHSLELSTLKSQIRTLETSLFEAEAREHAMQKQVTALENQLIYPPRSFSPANHSRPSSRADSHRMRPSPKPSALAVPLSRSIFDQTLSPETRHKRKVSLSMLKARIESEAAAAAAASSHSLSRGLSPVPEPRPQSRPASRLHHHRPQFLDESHVFWCHSCRGDLVVL